MSAQTLMAAVMEVGADMSCYEFNFVTPTASFPLEEGNKAPQSWMTGVSIRVARCPNCYKAVKVDGQLCSDMCRKAYDPN